MKYVVSFVIINLAVELNYGTVYCSKCSDYIYDSDIDQLCKQVELQIVHKQHCGMFTYDHVLITCNVYVYHSVVVSRQPAAYVAWEPSQAEIDLLRQNPKRRKLEPGSSVGM